MEDILPHNLRTSLIQALLNMPSLDTADGRRLLLVDLPKSLQDQVTSEGTKFVAISTMVQELSALRLDDNTPALSVFVKAALDAAADTQSEPDLKRILAYLSGLADLRNQYAALLADTSYAYLDLSRYVSLDDFNMPKTRISLDDVYMYPLVTAVGLNEDTAATGAGTSTPATQSAPDADPSGTYTSLRTVLASSNQFIVLLGDYVSTLSTHIGYYALRLLGVFGDDATRQNGANTGTDAEAVLPLPIVVPLERYAQELHDLPQLSIEDFAVEYYYNLKQIDLGRLFAGARLNEGAVYAVYLLDGLGKVPSDLRLNVSRNIDILARSLVNTKNRLLVTSQRAGYTALSLPSVCTATIEAVHRDVRNEFVGKLYRAWRGLRGTQEPIKPLEKVINELDQPAVARLADNPLMITLLTLLSLTRPGELPSKRLELYKTIATLRIKEWLRARWDAGLVDNQPDEQQALVMLGELAHYIHQDPTGSISRQELLTELLALEQRNAPAAAAPDDADLRSHIDHMITKLGEQPGVLEEKSLGRWDFSHITSREYFAAQWLAGRPGAEQIANIQQRAVDPRWTGVISLALASIYNNTQDSAAVTDLVQKAIIDRPDPYEDYLHRNLLLVGRVLADEPPPSPAPGAPAGSMVAPALAQQIARQLFDQMMATQSQALLVDLQAVVAKLEQTWLWPDLTQWAVAVAQQSRPATPALPGDAAPPTPDSARQSQDIARLSVFVHAPEVWNVLLELLLESPDLQVRGAAAEVLAKGLMIDELLAHVVTIDANADPDEPQTFSATLRQLADQDKGKRDAAGQALLRLIGEHPDFVRTTILPMMEKTDNSALVRDVFLPRLHDPSLDPTTLLLAARAVKPLAADPDLLPILELLMGPGQSAKIHEIAAEDLMNVDFMVLSEDARKTLRTSLGRMLGDPVTADAAVATLLRWAELEAEGPASPGDPAAGGPPTDPQPPPLAPQPTG